MKIIEPGFELMSEIDGGEILRNIERCGRVCYKSEDKITNGSAIKFITMLIKSGHESVLEHEKITVKIICDRGVSHEIVRHRLASYSQESTRYCNYSHDKFGSEITFIRPCFWKEGDVKLDLWKESMQMAEDSYKMMLQHGAKPEEARSVLPNSLKTEIVVTMNLREWRHFFKLRTGERAHPQIKQIALLILNEFKKQVPLIFDDIYPEGEGKGQAESK